MPAQRGRCFERPNPGRRRSRLDSLRDPGNGGTPRIRTQGRESLDERCLPPHSLACLPPPSRCTCPGPGQRRGSPDRRGLLPACRRHRTNTGRRCRQLGSIRSAADNCLEAEPAAGWVDLCSLWQRDSCICYHHLGVHHCPPEKCTFRFCR